MSGASTTTTPVRPVAARAGARSGPTFGRLVRSEWTKLTSLRSPWWVAAVTVAVTGAITYLAAEASSGDPGFRPVGSLSTGLLLGQLGPLVLGVLVGAGEFRTGTFRTTFTTAPRRWPVIAAQTLVVTVLALALGALATAASVVGILPAAASRGIPVDLTADETPGVMVGMALFLTGLALFGLGLGTLLRRTVPAVVTALSVVLVIPMVLLLAGDLSTDPLLAEPVDPGQLTAVDTILTFLPGGAGQLMTLPASSGPLEGAPDLGPVGGGLVLAAWVLVLLGAATARLLSRDVR